MPKFERWRLEFERWKYRNLTFEACLEYPLFHSDIGNLNDIANIDYFILSIPKAGTTAIQKALTNVGKQSIHAHTNDSTYRNISNGNILRAKGWGIETFVKYRLKFDRKIVIFSGFRDPVSWYISLAFQYGLRPDNPDDFYENFYNKPPWSIYGYAEQFALIERCTGINILEHEGSVIEGDGLTLVLYTLDNISEVEAYSRKHIHPDFELKMNRVTSSPDYLEFMRKFKPPIQALSMMNSDPYIKRFSNKWLCL